MKFKPLLQVLILSLSFLYSTSSVAYDNCSETSKKCSFAIFPHSNFKQLLITYKSLIEDLTLILDTRVKLVSSISMADFGTKLEQKAYDIALIGPGQYVSNASTKGYIPLARPQGLLHIKLFVRADSELSSYSDIVGKKVGYMLEGTTTRYAASILLHLNKLSIDSLVIRSQGSQQSCAHALAIRQVDACFLAESNLEVIKAQNVNVELKSIGEAFEVIFPIYAVHPDFPEELKIEVRDYLLNREGYIAVNDSDFDIFRQQLSQAQ